jgi:hypothetical protein
MDIPEVYTTGIDLDPVSFIVPILISYGVFPNSTVRKLDHEDPEP